MKDISQDNNDTTEKRDVSSKRVNQGLVQWQPINTPNSLNNLIPPVRVCDLDIQTVDPTPNSLNNLITRVCAEDIDIKTVVLVQWQSINTPNSLNFLLQPVRAGDKDITTVDSTPNCLNVLITRIRVSGKEVKKVE
jgi:hypothetical protein